MLTNPLLDISVFSILIYSFSLYMYDTEPKKEHELSKSVRSCGVNNNYTSFVYIFDNTVDSFLTLILPSTGILIMNIAIIKFFSKYQKKQKKILNESRLSLRPKSNLKTKSTNSKDDHLNKTNTNLIKSNNRRSSTCSMVSSNKEQYNSSRHITKTLLIVSFSFILLNSPYRASKLISYIRMTLTGHYVYFNLEYAINEVLINLYFTSYSVNFFLYSLCGKKFRVSLQTLIMFCMIHCYDLIERLFKYAKKRWIVKKRRVNNSSLEDWNRTRIFVRYFIEWHFGYKVPF